MLRKISILGTITAFMTAATALAYRPNFKWISISVPVTGSYVDTSNTDALPVFAAITDDGSSSTGIGCWKFPPSKDTSFYATVTVPNEWVGTTVYPSLHWMPITDGTTDYVVIGLEHVNADIDSTYGSSTLAPRTVSAATALKHYRTDLPSAGLALTDVNMGNNIMFRGYRTGTSASDGYTDYICIQSLNIDLEIDDTGAGSRKRLTR